MKKILFAILAGLALVLVAPVAAHATQPTVSGVGTCNPATGLFDVEWTVTSDPGYETAGTFTSSSRLADQIVGKAVAGSGAAIEPKPVESVATSAPLSLTVGIQFDNHARGDIASRTGSAVFVTKTCEVPLPEDREVPGDAVWADYDCEATDKTGEQAFTLYTYNRDEAGAVVESTSVRTELVTVALTPEEIAAKDADPACTPVTSSTHPPVPPVAATLPVAGPEDAIPAALLGAAAVAFGVFLTVRRKLGLSA